MSSLARAEIVLPGSIPSKKNSRINRGDGMSFVSKEFAQWQKDAITEVRRQCRQRFLQPVSMEVIIYFSTDARADLDNRLTSILDMLVEGMVLPDDKWQNVPLIALQAEYRPRKPGAFIRITELEPGFLGAELEAARAKRKAKKPLP